MDTPLENWIASYQKNLALEPANASMFGQLAEFYYTKVNSLMRFQLARKHCNSNRT